MARTSSRRRPYRPVTMKTLAATIAVLLLAGAGAGAGWWFFLREPVAAEGGGAVAEGPPGFVTLPVMTIPVIRGDRVSRTFVLQVTLELAGAGEETGVKAAQPLLVDAFLTELHALLARRLMEERGYDIGLMKHRLGGAAARILGPGQVTDILIQVIAQR